VSGATHAGLALVLTGVLVCQARALAAVLRARRVRASARPGRIIEMVWVAIPVAVVLFLIARSWIVVLDLGPPAMAGATSVEVAARSPSSPLWRP